MTQFSKSSHRAREALLQCGRDYPHAWMQADGFRQDKGEPGFDWPNWCFLPMGAAYAIVSGGGSNRVSLDGAGDVARLGALLAWRMTQGIYRFDPAVYDAVRDTPVVGDIPAQAIMQLPEWCVYVETPGMQTQLGPLHGFWAHLEFDFESARSELRLLLDTEGGLIAVPLHLGAWPLAESVARAVDQSAVQSVVLGMPFAKSDARTIQRELAEPLVSLLLYLCSAADFSRRGLAGQPTNPVPKRTRRDGAKLFAAAGPVEWDVGVRMGAALRAAYHAAETGQGTGTRDGSTPRGHIRRAHWHGYWSGAKKDDAGNEVPQDRRKYDLRWQPPIAVNLDGIESLHATVRKVS